MTTIYFKNAEGKKVAVTVIEEVAAADKATRQAGWRSEARERYYRDPKIHSLNDCDEEIACAEWNPEAQAVAAEEQAELRTALFAALKGLTPEQLDLVKMLRSGMSVSEIAERLGVSKAAVSQMRNRIQEKIKKYLK